MGVSPAGGSDGGGGVTVGGYPRIPPLEHSCAVHCNQAHYLSVYGGVEVYGFTGGQEVVGTGHI